MRQESAVALGKAEAERWVMDRSRSGRSTAGAGKATLDAIQVTADQIAALIERRQSVSKGAEWLLDNLHLIRRIGRSTVQSFHSGKALPSSVRRNGICAPSRWPAEPFVIWTT